MHQLLLMRHAKAERARPDLPDFERALAPSGMIASSNMRRKLQSLGVEPDVVLVSSARRTRETLEAVLAWDNGANIDIIDSLYMAPLARLLDLLAALRETARSVLIVGHNPGIGELAWHLAARGPESEAKTKLNEGFPTMRVAEFLVLTPWHAISSGTTRLQRVIDPV
jgi:phosphohistidine phosphatase